MFGWVDTYSLIYYNSNDNPEIYYTGNWYNTIYPPIGLNILFRHTSSAGGVFDTTGVGITSYGSIAVGSGGISNAGAVYNTSNIYSSKDIINHDDSSVWFSANVSAPTYYQLTVNLNPQTGGTVASDPNCLTCSSGTCTGTYTLGNVTLTATPSTDYAFGYWDNGVTAITNNPYVITMNGNKTLTAKFFKTFRNAVGSFYNTSGTYGNGECVTYVNHETGITKASGAAFTGNANTYYQEAIDEGYQTSSSIPRIGSIIVFAIDLSKGLDYGHVGIVTAINGTSITIEDQNWVATDTIGSHTEDVSTYNILGYIYYTP